MLPRYFLGLSLLLLILIAFNPFANTPKVPRIGIISDATFCGEREVGWRIKKAAESLGWEVFLDEKKGRILRKIKNLDWVICVVPRYKSIQLKCPTYLTIFHPFSFLDEEGKLLPLHEKYDGYLLTIDPPEGFESNLKALKKEPFHLPFYPTVQNIEYKKLSPNELTTMIPVWGNRLNDEKFKKLYASLGKSGFARFYGINENPDIIHEGYMGKVPFDGSSLINAIQKHGIVLVFHSDIHNKNKIPSARIFEAAAASAVIISDENSFVKKHFGDSVYYVDTSQPSNEIYMQIEKHIAEIQQNPEKALKMAQQAHQIFEDHFLMTHQLQNIQSIYIDKKKSRKWFEFGY